MSPIRWPGALRQSLHYATEVATPTGQGSVITDMNGPERRRVRYSAFVQTITPPAKSFICTQAQLDTLLEFYDTTLASGTLGFFWVDPVPGLGDVVCKFSESPGRPKYVGVRPGNDATRWWGVTFVLDVLPFGHPGYPLT